MDVDSEEFLPVKSNDEEISRFADSYESFTRVLNSLQRKYDELEKEFTSQNRKLADANSKLVELTARNIAATEFLNSILHSISAGVIALDEGGYITHFNRAASRMFGIPAEEPLGRHYCKCITFGTPADANALRTLESGLPQDSIERQVSLADGTQLRLSVSTEILRDGHGNTAGAVEVVHDLTKIKKMEQELTRLNTLAALGEMAATIAHEVRNPLSGIAGFASLLAADLERTDPKYKLVANIIRGTKILNETVTTLLNYTRFDETNKKETALNDFIQTTIDQFCRDNPERVKDVQVVFSPDQKPPLVIPDVLIDPMLFRQIFFNLFTNSINAFTEKGKIEVQSRVLPRQTAAVRYADRLLLGLDETVVEMVVSDNGPGIKPEELGQIFAPFFTNRQGGNGLGLAVASKIMKAHGGEILAENNSAGGATFRLLLPTKLDAVHTER